MELTACMRVVGEIRRKAIALNDIPLVKSYPLTPDSKFIRVYEPASSDVDIAGWVSHNREQLEADLLEYGGLLLRGFAPKSVSDFEKIATSHSGGDLYGGYGDLPRAGTSEKIYQSTPYPPEKPILYHNESSHLDSWPMKISFACLQKAQEGGATPLLDCRDVCSKLDPDVVTKFAEKGLMYVRTFSEGIDVSWQDFFKTDDKTVVENQRDDAGQTLSGRIEVLSGHARLQMLLYAIRKLATSCFSIRCSSTISIVLTQTFAHR